MLKQDVTEMPLTNTIGVPFSKLRENRKEAMAWFGKTGEKVRSRFDCCGCLPGGDRYGAAELGVWFDPGYTERYAVLVGADGACKAMTLLKDHYDTVSPDAMAASPTGRRIIWKIGGEVFIWDHAAFRSQRVRINDALPENTAVSDAVMRENGLLEMICSDGIPRRYLCDADALLVLAGGGWTAYCGESSCSLNAWILHDAICDDPLVNRLVLRDEAGRVEPYVFSDCGLHELRLSQRLESIGCGAFENNPDLTGIVVPASVTEVESGAFRGCTSLRGLVIEGDPARTLLWAEDAFSGCPCEKTYLQIRASARENNP